MDNIELPQWQALADRIVDAKAKMRVHGFNHDQLQAFCKQRQLNFFGLSTTSLSIIKNTANPDKGDYQHGLPNATERVNRFEKYIDLFIKEQPIPVPPPPPPPPPPPLPFVNTKWLFYFYHIPQPAGERASLGRAVLTFTNNKVILDNITEQGIARNYQCTIDQIALKGNDTFLLSLNHIGEAAKESCLTILFNYNKNDDGKLMELMLGKYINRFNSQIQSGTIVLQQCDMAKDVSAKSLTYKDKEFEEIDLAIREFLADKKSNYSKLPARVKGINTISGLKKFIASYHRGEIRAFKNSFINIEQPIVFIANPINALKATNPQLYELQNEMITQVLSKLRADYSHINFVYYGDSNIGDMAAHEKAIQKYLRHPTLIIMFYFADVLSNALLELSFSMHTVKKALVFTHTNNFFRQFHFFKFFKTRGLLTLHQNIRLEDPSTKEDIYDEIILELEGLESKGVI